MRSNVVPIPSAPDSSRAIILNGDLQNPQVLMLEERSRDGTVLLRTPGGKAIPSDKGDSLTCLWRELREEVSYGRRDFDIGPIKSSTRVRQRNKQRYKIRTYGGVIFNPRKRFTISESKILSIGWIDYLKMISQGEHFRSPNRGVPIKPSHLQDLLLFQQVALPELRREIKKCRTNKSTKKVAS